MPPNSLKYIYMVLRLCDFGMIMVWWFESGMIEWLWCDGLEVVYAKENNWRNCKQLWTKYTHFFLVFFKLRNTTQSTSLNSRFLQLFHFTRWLENFLKTSEDQVIKPSAVIRFDVCVSSCLPWRPWRAKVFFFILSFINNIKI